MTTTLDAWALDYTRAHPRPARPATRLDDLADRNPVAYAVWSWRAWARRIRTDLRTR